MQERWKDGCEKPAYLDSRLERLGLGWSKDFDCLIYRYEGEREQDGWIGVDPGLITFDEQGKLKISMLLEGILQTLLERGYWQVDFELDPYRLIGQIGSQQIRYKELRRAIDEEKMWEPLDRFIAGRNEGVLQNWQEKEVITTWVRDSDKATWPIMTEDEQRVLRENRIDLDPDYVGLLQYRFGENERFVMRLDVSPNLIPEQIVRELIDDLNAARSDFLDNEDDLGTDKINSPIYRHHFINWTAGLLVCQLKLSSLNREFWGDAPAVGDWVDDEMPLGWDYVLAALQPQILEQRDLENGQILRYIRAIDGRRLTLVYDEKGNMTRLAQWTVRELAEKDNVTAVTYDTHFQGGEATIMAEEITEELGWIRDDGLDGGKPEYTIVKSNDEMRRVYQVILDQSRYVLAEYRAGNFDPVGMVTPVNMIQEGGLTEEDVLVFRQWVINCEGERLRMLLESQGGYNRLNDCYWNKF